MALRVRYFIRVSKKADLAPIRVRFTNGRAFDVFTTTGEQIKPRYWNNVTGAPRRVADYPDKDREHLEGRLEAIKDFIKAAYNGEQDKTGPTITSDWLRLVMDRYNNPGRYIQKGTSLFGFIQHFVNNSDKRINRKTGNPVCYKMQREYERTFHYLKKYALKYGEPDFKDIDLEFYNNFTAVLRDGGLQINTIGKKIQTLKIFLNTATEDGINTHLKYKSKNFKAVTEEADNIYLNIDELQKFYEFNLSHRPGLERVRDLFVVACWTGLRYSDLDQITPDRIDNGLLLVKQTKTQGKIWVPLHSIVIEIMGKYGGMLPKPVSNQKYNESIKLAAKLAELDAPFRKSYSINGKMVSKKFAKHELISSHTARRSFCTNMYEMDIPTLTIMAISGHKAEAAFLKYIKVDGKKHAEKMRDMWQARGFHLSVAK